jgi:RimJ/RimL family protein N-acetyltransferase
MDPDVIRNTRVPPSHRPGSLYWLDRCIEGWGEARAPGSRCSPDGEFLGFTGASTIDRETGTAELGYVVAPNARGRGVATEALRLLTEWALAEVMVRIELLISVENLASQKVAERCGYVREGVLRSLHFKEHLRGDTAIYSLLPDDPR